MLQFESEINRLDSWDTKLNYMISKLSQDFDEIESVKFITNYLYQIYKSMIDYHFQLEEKLDVQVAVIRAKNMLIPMPADTGLNQVGVPQAYLLLLITLVYLLEYLSIFLRID